MVASDECYLKYSLEKESRRKTPKSRVVYVTVSQIMGLAKLHGFHKLFILLAF